MSTPQRHHYVPQFLLKRFADKNRKLLVHRTDSEEKPRWAPVRKTAQTLCGHTLYWPGRDPDHASVEAGMSSIEAETGKVIATLLANRGRNLSEEQREVLGFFIALQWQRSRFLIDHLERSVLDPGAPVDELAKSMGIRLILRSVIFPWFARRNGEIDPSETHCYIADWLQHGPWRWRLYRPTGPKLVVGDNIVCLWGVARGETSHMPDPWPYHGIGVGFSNCARVTVPLAPNLGLIIYRTDMPSLQKTSAAMFNRITIYNSREFVAHHPTGLPGSDLQNALLQDLWTQRRILPIILGATRSAAEKDAGRFTHHHQQAIAHPHF